MLKNEEKRLGITLNSLIGIVDSLVVYDTGSTDSTLDILKEFSIKHNIPLHLKQGVFEDFSTSRNVSLDFADEISQSFGVDFILLMDCNDELRGGNELIQFCKEQLKTKETAWLVNQEWFSGTNTKYYNLRLIKPNHMWRYRGVIHEYLQKRNEKDLYITHKVPLPISLFQDRTQDDDKSGKRFERDLELLLKEYEKNPKDDRTVFYLAQTYECLGLPAEAYKYYKLRTGLTGFYEEIFHCYLRMGNIARDHNTVNELHPENRIVRAEDNEHVLLLRSFTWEMALGNYMKAFQHIPRAEPMIAIAEYYRDKNNLLSFHFANIACELDFPTDAILFVNNHIYNYGRWHLLGIVAYYCKRFDVGYNAVNMALKAGGNREFDQKNMEFYNKVLFPLKTVKKNKKKRR